MLQSVGETHSTILGWFLRYCSQCRTVGPEKQYRFPLFLPYSIDLAPVAGSVGPPILWPTNFARHLDTKPALPESVWLGNFASMATEEPDPPTATPLPEEERAKARRQLREAQLQKALQELDARHQKERQALSQELRELAVGRKAVRDQLWSDWVSSPFPDLGPERLNLTSDQQLKLSAELPRADRCVHVVKHHLDGEKERAVDSRLATVVELGEEDAASKVKYLEKLSGEDNRRSSQQEDGASSDAALNGKERPGEGGEEIPYWVESVLKASQRRDKEKQALLKELLPPKNELHVEVQRLLEVLDERELREAYEHRIKKEDPHKIKSHLRTRRAGLWRFMSKKKLVEQEGTEEANIASVDSELGYPKLPGCYEEIKKLLDIEKNPIYSKALQEWNRKEELFSRRVERKKNRVASLKNEVYQLLGFFSVFQGVVLTAVSQSSFLFCHNKWSPIALSVLASVISTFGVIQKLNQINDLQRNIDSEERDFSTAVRVGQRLREPGSEGIDFVKLNVEIESNSNRESKLLKNRHLAWLYFVLVTLTLVAFGVLFPISFWRILCKPGAPPPAN